MQITFITTKHISYNKRPVILAYNSLTDVAQLSNPIILADGSVHLLDDEQFQHLFSKDSQSKSNPNSVVFKHDLEISAECNTYDKSKKIHYINDFRLLQNKNCNNKMNYVDYQTVPIMGDFNKLTLDKVIGPDRNAAGIHTNGEWKRTVCWLNEELIIRTSNNFKAIKECVFISEEKLNILLTADEDLQLMEIMRKQMQEVQKLMDMVIDPFVEKKTSDLDIYNKYVIYREISNYFIEAIDTIQNNPLVLDPQRYNATQMQQHFEAKDVPKSVYEESLNTALENEQDIRLYLLFLGLKHDAPQLNSLSETSKNILSSVLNSRECEDIVKNWKTLCLQRIDKKLEIKALKEQSITQNLIQDCGYISLKNIIKSGTGNKRLTIESIIREISKDGSIDEGYLKEIGVNSNIYLQSDQKDNFKQAISKSKPAKNDSFFKSNGGSRKKSSGSSRSNYKGLNRFNKKNYTLKDCIEDFILDTILTTKATSFPERVLSVTDSNQSSSQTIRMSASVGANNNNE